MEQSPVTASVPVTTRERLISLTVWTAILGGLGFALAPLFRAVAAEAAAGRIRPHLPDAAFWFSHSMQIQLHVYSAVAAFLVGLVILSLPKGTKLHKQFGWAWVALMAMTAVTSLFITELNGDYFSFIHLISGWTLVALPMGVYAIRRGKVRIHRNTMVGLFVGGMVIAGGLTLLPGRIMWSLFLG